MAVESDDSVSEIIRAAASSLGYAEIRLLQETAVRAFMTGSDVFLSILTDGGKSLCYAVLPRVFDMLWGNDTSQSLVILVWGSTDERFIRARIARLHFLLVTLRRGHANEIPLNHGMLAIVTRRSPSPERLAARDYVRGVSGQRGNRLATPLPNRFVPRAYRAAEGGERACNARSPYVDGEIQHFTKNNTSSHAREC